MLFRDKYARHSIICKYKFVKNQFVKLASLMVLTVFLQNVSAERKDTF